MFRDARRLASIQLRDMLRDRKAIRGRLIQPLAVMAGFALVFTLPGTRQDVSDRQSFTVAISGDRVGAHALLGSIDRDRFELKTSDDVRRAVIGDEADIGVIVPRGVDESIRRGNPPAIEVFEDSGEDNSRIAAQLFEVEVLEAANPDVVVPPTVELDPTLEGARYELGKVLPALLVFFLLPVFGETAESLADRRAEGVLPPLLVQPVDRAAVALSSTAAEAAAVVASSSVILVPVLLAMVGVAASGGLTDTLGVAGMLVLAATSLVVLAGVAGHLVAVRTGGRRLEWMSLAGPIIGIAFFAATIGSQGALPTWVTRVPGLGVAAVARSVAMGLPPDGIAVALGSTALALVVLLRMVRAARIDDLVTRGTNVA